MNTENAPKVAQIIAKSVVVLKLTLPELSLPVPFDVFVACDPPVLELEVDFGVGTVPV